MLKFLSRHRHPAVVPLEPDTRPTELASSKEKERVTLFQHDVAYKRLLHAVRELQGAVKQLEVGLNSIQAGQLEHQGGLVRTLATVEELSAATEEVAAAAQTSATVAEHADHLAEQGRDAVRQAHQKMDHIKKAVQETGATVKELGQKTTAITRIVDVIREIAAETNLLSLNASIEAARAGEAGRGFAVVAGEVRKLSEQSATQAKQIEGVIKEIGEEIGLVIARMNDSLAAVADGAAVVEEADAALAAIVDAAGQVNEMVSQISAAATQQATGSSQISEVVSEMATTSEQVSYAIDKAMMDAAQQHSALERLNSLTLHLGDISQNLGDRTQQAKPLQHYRWCIGGDVLTFDPHLCNEMTTTLVLSQIFMGLTRFGTDTRIVPGLARAWDLSPDGRTWTFQLRRGARFHNGREIKAADVKYSLERILRPATKSPNTWLVEMIQGAAAVISGSTQQLAGVKTEGDYTVHITLEYPYHPILANLAYIGTSIVPREVAELGKLATKPIGAGPFQLTEYEQGKRILLKAHADFYGGRPFLDELELVPKLAATCDLEALSSAEVNHLLYLGAQNMHAIENHPLYANRIQSTPVLRTNYLGINCGKSVPLQNPLVRQALNYAIDKETMIRELFGGRARVASGPLPPGCEGFDENLRPYPFDPNRAKAKLAEAGYPQGLPQPLLLHVRAGHEVQRQQAEMVRGWLAQIGIRLETKEVPWSELVTGACMRQCDLFFLGWTGDTGDPDNFLQPLFNSTNHGDLGNRTFFTDNEVDAKLAAGQSIRDPERRRQHYQELQRLLHELAPWVFLSYEDQFLVTRPEVRGLNLHPLGMVYLENAWLDPTMK